MSPQSLLKGLVGEAMGTLAAKLLLDAAHYHSLTSVTLQTGHGTVQIDHVIVSRFGIFVVEAKHYQGWIFGNEHQAQWTQCVYLHQIVTPGVSFRCKSTRTEGRQRHAADATGADAAHLFGRHSCEQQRKPPDYASAGPGQARICYKLCCFLMTADVSLSVAVTGFQGITAIKRRSPKPANTGSRVSGFIVSSQFCSWQK